MENGTRDIKNEARKKQSEQKRYSPNILSRFFFCWMCPVLIKGNKRNVEETDLIVPTKSYDSTNQGEFLERYWFQELEAASANNRKPSLWRAIRKAYFWTFMPGAALLTVHTVARTLQPIIFSELLTYWSAESSLSRLQAAYYAIAMLGVNFISMISYHHNSLFLGRFSLKLKVSCTAILYRKLMRINQSSVGDVAAGKLVNLMSNDVARFDYAFIFLHNLWMIPIQAGVVLYLLYQSAGYAPFVGVFGVFLVILPFQGMLTKFTANVRRETAKRTDHRIKLMNEIVNGIQVIKMYAWEKPFQLVVRTARKLEMVSLRKSLFIRSVFLGFMIFTERSILFVTSLTLVLSGTPVTATIIYPIQQYLSIIQVNLTMILPLAIASLSELLVSLDRIQEFLMLDERADLALLPVNVTTTVKPVQFNLKNNLDTEMVTAKKYTRNDELLPNGGHNDEMASSRNLDAVIELVNVSASWTKSQEPSEMTLKNLSLRIKKNELCAVIGPVGSGKSSLLQLLLKELPNSSGTVNVNGTLSYACQESWLFPATVRDNILFGLPYDYKKYNEVCSVCCLLPDFRQFPYGDLSLVGERGVSLSGGQRARINLARAIYRDADIYLLDDPLSAVDANVGRLLFDECVRGYLRGRTCILVTHQIHFLKAAEQLVIMNEGVIEGVGSYDDLLRSGKKLASMLSNIEETKETSEKTVSKVLIQRGISKISVRSGGEPAEEEIEQILQAEERSTGTLKWEIIMQYLKSTGSWPLVFIAIVFLCITQAAATGVDYWLSFWTNQVDEYEQSLVGDQEFDTSLGAQVGLLTTRQYISIYGGFILFIVIFAHLRIILYVATTMRASENIHDSIFQNLIRSVMRFFDTNPSGRILNRFSKDMGAMDELLPRALLDTMQMYFLMTSILVLNAIALPWTLIPTFVLVIIFILLLKWYINTAQAVKRLEGTTKSPVFGIISSSISGLSTIRSANAQKRLVNNFDDAQDLHSSAFFTFLGGTVAFSFYLDMLCLLYLGSIIAIFLVIDFGESSVGNVGLAVTQSMILTMILQHTARFTTDLLAQFTSVERVLEYTKLPTETNIDEGKITPPLEWPDKGHVEFRNVFLRYSLDDPPVLKNLNFDIQSGWKVGVVGRTGAGKSSLISALFRLSNIEGSVKLDGINTEELSKQQMRSKVSIIPQEPVLFSSTIRYNLDPFDLYSDDDIWRSLEQVELKEAIPTLEEKVSEGGSNFSVGQRQLLCLARAVLRSNKILVMDEATANVDPQTDALIQKTIRREFATCTVITIAHRLNTIMDSDRVMVMDRGELVEYDYPYILLNNPNSRFTFMVNETGEATARNLYEIAKIKYLSANPDK